MSLSGNTSLLNTLLNAVRALPNKASGNATADKVLSPYTFSSEAGSGLTGTIQSQGAQTITPGTSDQTIPAGKYLSGAQTIKGDANLVAANIASGVSIFGVNGTHEGGTEVHTASGTLSISRGSGSVTLDFTPDVFVMYGFGSDNGYTFAAAADFSVSNKLNTALWTKDDLYDIYVTRNDNTVSFSGCLDYDESLNSSSMTRSFSYKAYKFT